MSPFFASSPCAILSCRLAIAVAAVLLAVSIRVVATGPAAGDASAGDTHAALFTEDRFPSAVTCATCHAEIYREWSVSAHAYAQVSPVFNAMQAKIDKLTNGTNGDFCVRCHTPVGMNLGEPTFMSTLDRHPASREGVTCVVCHRQDQAYGKISGRLPLVEGSLYDPVFGPSGNGELRRVIETGDLNLQTDPERPGRAVHAEARGFFQLPRPGLCGSCHDVNFVDGFRLEEAFSEYKHSPAAGRGVSCQDCHMGTEPGVPSGYATGPAARVGDRPTRPRKRTNHMFAGPDYSVVHPGIFPHNPEAQEFATLREWLTFDYEAGWGTDAFEGNVPDDYEFPPRWAEPDDRYDAVDILRDNLDLLAEMDEQRRQLLRVGYRLGEVAVDRAGRDGVAFRVELRNGTDGHNVPTGFDAERLVWLHVTVTDAAGTVVLESGDLDPNGDVRDSHSVYVHDGALPADDQLFSLQSRFLVRMVRGGEREQVLAIPYSPSPLVFLRPSTSSTILTGRPAGARKHRRTIPPRRSKWASYSVGPEALAGTAGPYYATIRIKAGMVPVNLVHEIADVGFDYGMTEREVAEAVVAGHVVVRERSVNLSAGGKEEPPPAPLVVAASAADAEGGRADAGHDTADAGSGLSDEPVPLQLDAVPDRPKPLLEIGPRFLGTGRIGRGFTLPGGAVWRPSFVLFGGVRSGVEHRRRRDRARQRVGEPHRPVRQPRPHRQREVRVRATPRRPDRCGRRAPVQRLHRGGTRRGRLQPAVEPRLGHGDPPVLRGRRRRAVPRPGPRRPARARCRPVGGPPADPVPGGPARRRLHGRSRRDPEQPASVGHGQPAVHRAVRLEPDQPAHAAALAGWGPRAGSRLRKPGG